MALTEISNLVVRYRDFSVIMYNKQRRYVDVAPGCHMIRTYVTYSVVRSSSRVELQHPLNVMRDPK